MVTGVKNVTNSYLSRQILLLQIVLLWPVRTKGFMKLLTFLLFLSLVIWLSISTTGLFCKFIVTADLVERSEAVHIFTLTFSCLFKYLYLVAHRETLFKLVAYVNEHFLETQFYGNEELTMKSWMKWTPILSTMHCLVAFVIITFWGLCPIIKYLCDLIPYTGITLPISVWYPYDFNRGFQFIPLYVLHYFTLILAVQIYMSIDAFFFSLIHFASGQIEIVKASLRGLQSLKPYGTNTEESQHLGLVRCIKHHNKIIRFIRELDILSRPMIGADVLHSVVALSFSMLQASESRGIFENLKLYLFVTYSFLHQYLNSFFGQQLINQQESLLSQIYSFNWEDNSVSFRRSICTMMACSLTPLKFSAWTMYFLQYETLVEFVRLMVSFFMVLRNLREHI